MNALLVVAAANSLFLVVVGLIVPILLLAWLDS